MKNSDELEKVTKKLESQIWLRNMQLKLHKVFRGEKPRDQLCRDILACVVEITSSDVGAFYFMENDELYFISGHAYPSTLNTKKNIKIGEGLSGLAAANNKIQVFDSLERANLVLESSTQSVCLKSIMAVPLPYEGGVLGVIEIGAIKNFLVHSYEFMDQIRESIAISLSMVLSRENLKAMVDQARLDADEIKGQAEFLKEKNEELAQQTEELQSRQEEIEQSNEELEEQRSSLEEQSRQLEEQTSKLEANNQDLTDARDKLEAKTKALEVSNKYKSEFLANMSHELRTPLNSILVLSQLFVENKSGALDENQIKSAGIIFKCGNDLLTLINDILDLSKVEANRMEIEFTETHTASLLDGLIDIFNVITEQKDLAFDISIDDDFPKSFVTDPMRLEQILRNFLSNAIKFTEKGFVNIHCYCLPNEGKIAISVKDSGVGISNDMLEDIFNAFQQIDGSTARKYGGTGLGLSIATRLASLLHGEIKVVSEPEKGSAFTIILPLTIKDDASTSKIEPQIRSIDEQVNEPDIQDDRNDLDPKLKTILIVEDDINFASVLISFAHQSNFQVLHAATGASGLDDAIKYLPEGIILDVQLPELDGISVLKALKDNDTTRHIPVHVMSIQQCESEVLSLGALSFLQKPVDKKDLEIAYTELFSETIKTKRNILLVENNQNERDIVCEYFKDFPITIEWVRSTKLALSYLKENKVDGIILDLALDNECGTKLLDAIMLDANLKLPPVIIYTNKDLTKSEKEKLSEYSQSVVSKGFHSKNTLLDKAGMFFDQIARTPKGASKPHLNDDNLPVVIIVDDDERNAFALKELLDSLKLLTVSAKNGKEAVEVFKEHSNAALIIMDMMMPVMDGFKATQEIREISKTVPIIALTAKAMKEDKENCLKAGCTDYMSKPINNTKLLSLVKIRLGF